mmetsp:Transcript_4335/g.13092  ORF Transcript_4335/g.13092 Transcript_4335/m.13092 type:complete len:1155 (-) Transcript_4335:65-3529(-)
MLTNDEVRELLFRYEGTLARVFEHYSNDATRLDLHSFIRMATQLGLHPNIPNDVSTKWLLTHVYLRSQQGVRCGLEHNCVYEKHSNFCSLCRRRRGAITNAALLRLRALFKKHSNGNIGTGLLVPEASSSINMPLRLVQRVLLEWDPKTRVGQHLVMRLTSASSCRRLIGYLTWEELQETIYPGHQLRRHSETNALSFSEFVLCILILAQLQQERNHELCNIAAINLVRVLTLIRRSSCFFSSPQPSLQRPRLESVRKALHDQLYPIFRHYCSLGTKSQQSHQKLCLETYFLFVNDASLYTAMGYVDFRWIMTAKLRKRLTEEITLFQFLLFNEECIAEDYIISEELRSINQNILAETNESGLSAHCMGIVDRLRTLFESYLLPSRLTNFKRATVCVYTQANISGEGRAKPRMRGIGAPVRSFAVIDLWGGGMFRTPHIFPFTLFDLHKFILDAALDELPEAVSTDTESVASEKSAPRASSSERAAVSKDADKRKLSRLRKHKRANATKSQIFQDSVFSYAHARDTSVAFCDDRVAWQRDLLQNTQSKLKKLLPHFAASTTNFGSVGVQRRTDLYPARTLLSRALMHAQKSRHQQAMFLLQRALELASINRLGSLLPHVLGALACVATAQKNWATAVRYLTMQLNIASRDNTPGGLRRQVQILNQLGKMHMKLKTLSKAVECYACQAQTAQKIGDHAGESLGHYNHGHALAAMELLDDALLKFKDVEKLSLELDCPRDVFGALAAQAALYCHMGDHELARITLRKEVTALKQLTLNPARAHFLVTEISPLATLVETSRRLKEYEIMFATLRFQLNESRRLGSLASQSCVYRTLGQVTFAVHLQLDLPSHPKFFAYVSEGADEETHLLMRSRLATQCDFSPYYILPTKRTRSLFLLPKSVKAACAQARCFFECGYKIAQTFGQNVEETLEDIAVSYFLEGNFDEAEDRFMIGLSMREQNGDLPSISHTLGKLGLLEIRRALCGNDRRRKRPLTRANMYISDQLKIHEHLQETIQSMPSKFTHSHLNIYKLKATAYSFLAAANHMNQSHDVAIAAHKAQLENAEACRDRTAIIAAAVLISATVQHTVIQRPTCVGVFFASHSDLGSSLPFTCLLLDRGCCDGNSSHQSYFTDVQTAHCLVRDRIKRQSNFVRFRTK